MDKAVGSYFIFWLMDCTMFGIIMVGVGMEELVVLLVGLVLLVIKSVRLVVIYLMDYFCM